MIYFIFMGHTQWCSKAIPGLVLRKAYLVWEMNPGLRNAKHVLQPFEQSPFSISDFLKAKDWPQILYLQGLYTPYHCNTPLDLNGLFYSFIFV